MKKFLCLFVSLLLVMGLFGAMMINAGETDSSNSNNITISPEANSAATAIAVSESKFEVKLLKCNLGRGWTWDVNGKTAPLPQDMTQKDLKYKMTVKKFNMPVVVKEGSLVKGLNEISFKPYKYDRQIVKITIEVLEIKGSASAEANSAAVNNVVLDVNNNNDVNDKDSKDDNKGKRHNDSNNTNTNASNDNDITINPTANSAAVAIADGDNSSATANSAAVNLVNLAVDNNNTIESNQGNNNNGGHNNWGHHNGHNGSNNTNTNASNENDITITPVANSSALAIANGDNSTAIANSYAINNIYNIVNNYNTIIQDDAKKKDSISYAGSKTTTSDGKHKKVKVQEEYIVPVENTEIDVPKGTNKEVDNTVVMSNKDSLPKTGEEAPSTLYVIVGIALVGLGASAFGIKKYAWHKN